MRADEARLLLGVSPSAGPGEVDRAFRRLARRHHPDTGGDPTAFRLLVEARATLRRLVGDVGNGHAGPPRAPLIVRHSPTRRMLRALRRRLPVAGAPPGRLSRRSVR